MPVIHIFTINPTVTNETTDKKSRFSYRRGKRIHDQISIAPYI